MSLKKSEPNVVPSMLPRVGIAGFALLLVLAIWLITAWQLDELQQLYQALEQTGWATSDIMQNYRDQRDLYLATVLGLTLIAVSGLGWLLWTLYRRDEYLQALVRSENRNLKLLNSLRNEHQHILEAASRDHLTGLYNRRLFMELAHSHLLGSKRQGRFAAVCFIDLDRFKLINDTLGHKVGDLLLQEVARRLYEGVRESDIVSRFGGDEFVVMLTEVRRQEDVEVCVRHLVDTLSAPYAELQRQGLSTSPSIGVAISPRDGVDIETLVKHADMAMYRAKRAGRGQYAFYDPRQGNESGSKPDLSQLSIQVLQQQLCVHYQPCISLRGYLTTGLEALVRWDCPGHGLIEIRLLEALYGIGLELIIDDFGCGEIGLEHNRLERIRFSQIKIERSFIRNIRNNYDDNVILTSIASMARRKGMQVAAKGVETPDQLVCLKLSGCDEVQGFFFSRALSAADVRRYLVSPQCSVPLADQAAPGAMEALPQS